MRNFLLIAAVAMLGAGCASSPDSPWQFNDNNFARARIGGGAAFAFGDLLAHDSDNKHGDRTNFLGGDVKVGTKVFETESVSADVAVGPEIATYPHSGDNGVSYGLGVDVRVYYTTLGEDTGVEWLQGVSPFATAGIGLNYTDLDQIDGGKWGMPLKPGLGILYQINEQWSISGEYNLHHLTGLGDNFVDHGHTSHGTSSDVVNIGVQYSF